MLILTGGIGHPFADASAALAGIMQQDGIETSVTEDIETGAARLADGGFDLLCVYALRWRMLIGDKYAPHRAQWAFSPSVGARAAIRGFVSGGGGLIALHTAVICFDDWPDWGGLIGGAWVWGRSSHPPFGRVLVTPVVDGHSIIAGVREFETTDEVYSNLEFAPDIQPLLRADAGEGSKPVLWARQVGRGRVVTDLLGHDRAALEQSEHRTVLKRSALWASGLL